MARKYTDEQRAEAVRLFIEVGPSEAARRLGMPEPTVALMGKRAGAKSNAHGSMRAANLMRAEIFRQRREELAAQMLDKVRDALVRMDEPHVEFAGKDATRVVYPKAPAGAFRDYAAAAATLMKEIRLERGESTERVEQRLPDLVRDDQERTILRGILIAELERRGEVLEALPAGEEHGSQP